MEDKFEKVKRMLAGEALKKGPKSDPDDPKSIIIDGKLHKEYKDYCRFSKKKIGGLTEDLIRLYLSNPDDIQKLIDVVSKGGNQ